MAQECLASDFFRFLGFSLGFVNAVTIDDVKAAYPLLDMVDHENRKSLVSCTLLFVPQIP